MAQLPKSSGSPPSLNPPAQSTPQPRPGGTTSQPPRPNPPSTEAPRTGSGGEQGSKGEASADHAFAVAAANGGLAEVEMGKLGAEHASNADVKKFAQKMVDDHGKANDELSGIIKPKNITPPTSLSGKEKSAYDRLSKLTGAAFDRAYMNDMVKDHEKDVKEFEHESTSGKDPDLKAFASRTLPTLQDHLKMAKETQSKLGGGKGTN
jgi:putative membrane protein